MDKILIVSSADNVDLLCEYISLIRDVPFPKCGFSNRINKSDIIPYGMIFSKNRFLRLQMVYNIPVGKTGIQEINYVWFQ